MTDPRKHTSMETDPVGTPKSPYKRQKLETASLYDEMELPQAPSAKPTMGSDRAVEHPIISDGERAKEIEYGITEFVSTELLGFSGIVKKRYTDFLVNEILPSGEVVHLTNLRAPNREQKHGPSNGISSAAAISSKTHDHVRPPEQRPGTAKHETFDQTTEQTSIPSKQEEPATDREQGYFQSTEKAASEDGICQSSPWVKQEEIDSNTHFDATRPISEPSFPLLDSNDDQIERLSPHKRILANSSPIPVSLQDQEKKEPETPRRKRTKVLIRQTSRGWVEVDPEQEKELEERKAEDAGVKEGGSPPEVSAKEGVQPEEVKYEPKASTQAEWQAFAGGQPTSRVTSDFQLNHDERDFLTKHLGPEVVDALVGLYNRIVKSPHRKSKDYGAVGSKAISRGTRSQIHQGIRRIFNSRLESVTDNNGSIVITAMPEKPTFHARTPVGNGRDRESNPKQWNKPTWEELGGDYLHFTLFKENKDTMESISWLAKELKLKPGNFQFAGTKDRRAVTVQRVSVYRVLADRMISAGRTLRNARIGNFEYRPYSLQLGELSGNEFVVTLRDCDFHYPCPMDSKTITEGAESIVGAAIESLSEKGFINYYGLQRFGTFSTSTSEVGLKLLQGDFKAAVDAILHFAPTCLVADEDPASAVDRVSRDDKARAHAIHTFKTTGYVKLYDMPRKFSAETSIIRHMTRKGGNNDYLGALLQIQRNLRLMYVHAYQSLVWNVAASERWKRFGPTVVEGDLVLIDEHADKAEPALKKESVDEDGEAIVHPAAEDRAADPDELFTRARHLSKEEAESGNYSIFDIVLPTPGYDILYPANEMEKFYEEFMGSERGGGLDPHDMRRSCKDFSLSGSYRKLLASPGKDISFEIRVYDAEDEQFVETDLERLENGSHGNTNTSNNHSQEAKATNMEIERQRIISLLNPSPKSESSDREPGGVRLSGGLYKDFKIAAILRFQLGTSQYATVALRELMKIRGVKVYKADFSGGR